MYEEPLRSPVARGESPAVASTMRARCARAVALAAWVILSGVTACATGAELDLNRIANPETGGASGASPGSGGFPEEGGSAGMTAVLGNGGVSGGAGSSGTGSSGALEAGSTGGAGSSGSSGADGSRVDAPAAGGRVGSDGGLCGTKVCAYGEYCCSASCSVCVPQGGSCGAAVCTEGGMDAQATDGMGAPSDGGAGAGCMRVFGIDSYCDGKVPTNFVWYCRSPALPSNALCSAVVDVSELYCCP